jgi:hypothetical protein
LGKVWTTLLESRNGLRLGKRLLVRAWRTALGKTFWALALAVALALPAFAQDGNGAGDPAAGHPVTLGKGPKDGELVPAWIFYWVLGGASVVCGGLLAGLKVLWSTLQKEREEKEVPGLSQEEHDWLKTLHELHAAKDEDGLPRWYMPRTLPAAIGKLTTMAQEALEQLSKLGDARADRQAMRTAFDTEKAQMREIYTAELKSLQEKLAQEQRERREETQNLWQKNDATTREVMTVIRDMIVALENASKVIDAYHEVEE